MISFTIDGVIYQAEEGMTWEEWINSDYNDNTFGLMLTSDDRVFSSNRGKRPDECK